MRNPVLHAGVVADVCRVGLGVVLAIAGATKLYEPGPTLLFVEAITGFRIPGFGVFLGLAELLLGIFLIARFRLRATTAAAVSMSVAFFTVHTFSRTLPEPPPPCGCLGIIGNEDVLDTPAGRPLNWMLLSAGMIIAGGVSFLRGEPSRPNSAEGDS